MNNNIKIVFMGTPEFAVPILQSLIDNYSVDLVVTQPDKYVGRKKELAYSPVKNLALENNIKVFQPEKIRNDYKTIIDINPDIIITCAYGQIIPRQLIECPPLGCINVHVSLLPKYRGGAPMQRAIMNGEDKTGITIMYMNELMDEGDIIEQIECEIKDNDTYGTIHDSLSKVGSELLIKILPSIISKTNKRIPQNNDEATYAYTIKREDEHLDFTTSSIELYNHVRGLNPYPYAFFILDDLEYKVIECHYVLKDVEKSGIISEITKDAIGITSNDGIVYITKIKASGKKAMPVKDFLNGVDADALIGKEVK